MFGCCFRKKKRKQLALIKQLKLTNIIEINKQQKHQKRSIFQQKLFITNSKQQSNCLTRFREIEARLRRLRLAREEMRHEQNQSRAGKVESQHTCAKE